MTCEDCKFYQNECESHSQAETIGRKRGLEICEIFSPKFVECSKCIHFKVCQSCGVLTGRLISCNDYREETVHGLWLKAEHPVSKQCSRCGKFSINFCKENLPYCPYCGAKMEGEVE